MAETVRIEIPIETIDQTDPGLSNVTRNFERMENAAESANGTVKKANDMVSQFDKQAQKTEKSLASWAKEKYEILLEAKDRITPILSMLRNGLRGFVGKTWSVTMQVVDRISSPVRGIINLLKNPVFQVGAVLGVSIGLKDTIETYQDFEAAMSQVQAISGATDSEVMKLTNKAKEMGATTKFTAKESAEAFNYMAMAGWQTADMLNGIEGILSLAAASGEDLATTSDIVTDALTAFNMKAGDAGRFSDVLAAAASNANTSVSGMGETFKYAGSMAGALGYSIEDVALMTGLMANSGTKGTMAGTALNSIFTRLSTNTNGAADAMSDLGIAFFTSEGNARDLSDVMGELRNATANMTAEQKSQLANTIAGTQAQKGLLAILNASEEDYNKLADAINNADGAAAKISGTMLDNLSGSITLLQSAVDGVKISFGERLAPYAKGIVDWLRNQMPVVEQSLEVFMDWFDIKMDRMRRKFHRIADTDEWQNVDFFGKVKIVWDEFITEPFSEWWNSTGKAKVARFAQDIGLGIGTGLKVGIMTLLGIDIGETLDEGVQIGASFAKGFSEGFDFKAISEKLWQGFGNLLSSAGKLLPSGEAADLSSILSAIMLSRIVTPFLGMGKGAAGVGKGLFRKLGSVSMAEALDGSVVVGGTGVLGLLGKTGITFGSGAVSGAGLVLAGGSAIAGGVAAGATLGSSVFDAYKAMKSDNKEEAKVYGKSAAWKGGGVAAGATAGAAIGSMIPGVGTVVGGLVGAGVGGIAGWRKGNKVKGEYQENIEQMQKEAEKAQKVFDATGLSIEEVTFKNEALAQAMNDSEVSAAQFALLFQEECANIAKKAFGDISLSLAEVKKVASEITFAEMAEELSEFSKATSDTEAAWSSLQSSVVSLKKENWKVGLGMELSETDTDSYKSTIKNFLSTSQNFIDDNYYQATVALKLLTREEADTTGLDRYYGGLKSRVEDFGAKLIDSMNIALEDGVITLDEAAELENLQEQISVITNKLSEAKMDAKMQALQIKYHGAALDLDSFHALQEELQANVASASEQYESALTLTLTNLNLQLADGAITQSEYDEAVEEATQGYYAQINELSARVSTFNLESIATAWDSELSKLMPDMEGSITEKLSQVLNHAMLVHPDVKTWTTADVIRWIGLDKLSLDTAEQTTIAAELLQTVLAIPEGTQLMTEWTEAGTAYGEALNQGASTSILAGSPLFRTALQTTFETATASLFTISPIVRVTPNYKITAPTFPIYSQNVSGHAAGGYVSGGPQLSWLAEEGYGEFVIPTNPNRRARALDLYEQAGVALGASTDGETAFSYEPVAIEKENDSRNSPVQVSISVAPEFVIYGSKGQGEEDIMQVIRRHMKEIADELGGEIAGKLEEVFSNMPLKEA